MSSAKKEFRCSVPECDDNWIEVCQRLERVVEETREAHVGYLDSAALAALAHDQNVGRFEIAMEDPVGVQIVDAVEYLIE